MKITFEEIEEELDGRKMFYVNMERSDTIYVVAKDVEEAKRLAVETANDDLKFEFVYEINDTIAKEVKSTDRLHIEWAKDPPCSLDQYTLGFSCREYLDYLKEKERKRLIAEELDKKQLKFDL